MILYVETNLIIGIAKGQDAEAQNLLLNPLTSISIVIPSVCFLEAKMTLMQIEKYNEDFVSALINQRSEATRDTTSGNAMLLSASLQQSSTDFSRRFADTKQRFNFAYSYLASRAEEIPLEVAAIQDGLDRSILEDKHLIDKIILECIIRHARLHPDATKVFLSFNSKEFGKREVAQLLQDNGIRYFSKTTNFLGWLQAQNP